MMCYFLKRNSYGKVTNVRSEIILLVNCVEYDLTKKLYHTPVSVFVLRITEILKFIRMPSFSAKLLDCHSFYFTYQNAIYFAKSTV
jgi:hypothetical protein